MDGWIEGYDGMQTKHLGEGKMTANDGRYEKREGRLPGERDLSDSCCSLS
ncbi:hypothetical protein NEUTE1DRAFT_115776 [Neurospora tetrasperma FGSC 2508]|uniref:Uncharacterized protein n=1 Tax=Neurospora tetrasperma (strain FGSC 2508 / ATCC MYA-4615 / P0657) TaxID=510951 RepID=F8MD21_NEUT8|nr:uncharacterized protein NEUTE1DRAFT_115776 [Neurospora tetrasperma FGSC 2508]EGO60565.1 hypothetical protein NEUTE1DRAFT_115776 [Neurospora tetrasperma FGSC 2508]EGZ75459.1 hypothetical protein NEUTE2DRAFT_143705 [Neurospora tetrasperma FGSC 2509]